MCLPLTEPPDPRLSQASPSCLELFSLHGRNFGKFCLKSLKLCNFYEILNVFYRFYSKFPRRSLRAAILYSTSAVILHCACAAAILYGKTLFGSVAHAQLSSWRAEKLRAAILYGTISVFPHCACAVVILYGKTLCNRCACAALLLHS